MSDSSPFEWVPEDFEKIHYHDAHRAYIKEAINRAVEENCEHYRQLDGDHGKSVRAKILQMLMELDYQQEAFDELCKKFHVKIELLPEDQTNRPT